ncbi:hypothetical protein E2C01_075817 [Portunus trituberculatus]|uniref:Uncharacterized protein n=1 Tax=Portunus trituberculatus TaxID=210409 RepID=A0A5B7I9N7_PORTR|nr:hypothetical protein [Portunus trituberculatus]
MHERLASLIHSRFGVMHPQSFRSCHLHCKQYSAVCQVPPTARPSITRRPTLPRVPATGRKVSPGRGDIWA